MKTDNKGSPPVWAVALLVAITITLCSVVAVLVSTSHGGGYQNPVHSTPIGGRYVLRNFDEAIREVILAESMGARCLIFPVENYTVITRDGRDFFYENGWIIVRVG